MTKKYVWQSGLAIAVVGAASVGAIALAAPSDNGAPASENPVRVAAQPTTTDDHDGRGPWGGGPWRGGMWGGGFGEILGEDVTDLLHGEVALATESGGTQTVLVQKGAVTEVSATSLTVKSTDGFTTSYTVNGDTRVKADSDEIGAVAKDEEVVVVAPKSGEKPTATLVVDTTDLGWK